MNVDNEFETMEFEAIEELYKKYKEAPENVDESFRYFFQGFELANTHFPIKPNSNGAILNSQKELDVMRLITQYRRRGHLFTKTNPVRSRRSYTPTLALDNFNLSDKDLDIEFEAGKEIGLGRAKLRDILSRLEATYCASIGVEYRYMTNPDKVRWLQEKMEFSENKEKLSVEDKQRILNLLVEAS
ncbi:MAG TPA: hypothetical protein VKX35_07500, partial [Fermentimonas sp.]|nr:hypothetical protein [Fermentimonas sp.]